MILRLRWRNSRSCQLLWRKGHFEDWWACPSELHSLGNLDQQSLVRFLDRAEAFTKPDLPETPDPSCTLASVLVIGNSGRAEEASHEETSQPEEACLQEAQMIFEAAVRVDSRCLPVLKNPTRDQFLDAVDDFILDMVNHGSDGSTHLFYYAGDGCEIQSFRFIPCGATRPDRDYIALGDIMEKIDKQIQRRNIVFCIDSCRNNPNRETVRDRFDNERGILNRYCLLFRTAVGNEINEIDDDEEDLSVFARTVVRHIDQLASAQIPVIPDWVEQIVQAIKDEDPREDPWFSCSRPVAGSFRTIRSSSASSISSRSPLPGGMVCSKGYSIFHPKHSPQVSPLDPQDPEQFYYVTDIRKAHRRRVNRMKAETVDIACIILGCSEGRSAAEVKEDFAERGMGPNYFITLEGNRIVLVKEELCAWDYNIACWHAEEVKEVGHISGTGHVNEVKSYAVSISLEGSGKEPYRPKQYTALISLLKRLIADYQVKLWNIVGAGEIMQPPPKAPKVPQPGPQFKWEKLEEAGCALAAKPRTQEQDISKYDLKVLLQQWGYAWGDDSKGFERRLQTFRQRYRVQEPEEGCELSLHDVAAVRSLIEQRNELKAAVTRTGPECSEPN
ncbi:ampD [Symbiodinium sp. CCMP2456]|nr:ampD [Symbiodinium sp. CCMP2456]